jgi:glucose-1-phosphate adenylyltransferase
MNIYLLERELLIDLIADAFVRGYHYFERDVIMPRLQELNVQGYLYEGYAARILSEASYFEESMKMLDEKNLDALFSPSPIYTKIRDDNPTRYLNGAKVSNVMAADGCVVEGEVENSILFRGVKIGKGAKVKNCVLMQDTVVEDGASIEYIITDKNVTISAGKEMKGTDIYQVYVAKHEVV